MVYNCEKLLMQHLEFVTQNFYLQHCTSLILEVIKERQHWTCKPPKSYENSCENMYILLRTLRLTRQNTTGNKSNYSTSS